MAGVDIDKMKKHHKEQQKGGDFGNFEAGETLVYICPPCRDNDEEQPTTGLNYVPLTVHYKLGPKEGVAASLDAETNPIINHSFVRKELAKSGKLKAIKESKGCPIAKALATGRIGDPDESRAQTKYLWNMIPLKHRAGADDEWRNLERKVTPFMIGKTIYEGIMDLFFEHGDLSDPDAAILVKIGRKGSKMNTKYTVKVESSTLKKPFVLSDKMKAALIAALKGPCDLFKVAATFIKTPVEISAMLKGMETTSSPDDDDDETETEDEPIEDDEEEVKASSKKKAKKPAPKDEDDDEDADEDSDDDDSDSDDEDEDETPKKSSKKPAPKKKPADDDDEDDEEADDDADEEEDETPPKKKAKKPAPKDDDDDADDSDDDEETPPKKSSKKPAKEEKPAKKPKKGSESTDEDEDVEGLDDLEKELAELDKKSSKKPSKKSKPAKDEDEEDDE